MSGTFIGNSTAIQELFKRISEQFTGAQQIILLQGYNEFLAILFSYVPSKGFPSLVHG